MSGGIDAFLNASKDREKRPNREKGMKDRRDKLRDGSLEPGTVVPPKPKEKSATALGNGGRSIAAFLSKK